MEKFVYYLLVLPVVIWVSLEIRRMVINHNNDIEKQIQINYIKKI